ncbi:break repair meiotic recombinase recruitment factor 1 isoform X2 [Hemicordylus capensis]|uniref:break repair meiotic recombinase recruitment factor 1 isoform X2 n=1 Tax=Hemicordylus capensis TaxID=884348 RepID=UPI0023028423|nr:break repair meiotic recombinase recruitment factor 1 isoform X2 [Hemicordylus capensis]XP_053152440.1 break repair meiotic recombinase recruitment factor 1 isoform X2 [Hemicordylus capensis]
MSKRKKVQISEIKELDISKAKRSFRKKAPLTGESDLEKPVQTLPPSSNSPSKVTIAGASQECQGNNLENTDTEISAAALDTSESTEEGGKASPQRKELGRTKAFLPPSQGGKIVPVFTKPKKPLTEKHERGCGEAATVRIDQDMLESSNVQCMVRNVLDTSERTAQNTFTPPESLVLMDLFVTKVEDVGHEMILPCEERSEMPDQDRIRSDGASHQANICKNEMPEKQVSFVLNTSDNEDVEDPKKRELSTESLRCPLVREMSFMLREDRISDSLKNSQKEEKHLSSLDMAVEQNKAIQDIIKPNDVKEADWAKNGNRKDTGPAESMASQTQKENSRAPPPLMTDASVLLTLEEQSRNLPSGSVAREGSGNGKGSDQSPLHRNGKAEEQNGICSSTEILELRDAQCSSTISGEPTDQHRPWMGGIPTEQSGRDKPTEQSSPCRSETIVEEQIGEDGQDILRGNCPDTACIDLDEAGISGLKCEQAIKTSNLVSPQPDGESRQTSVPAVACSPEEGRSEKETGIKAGPTKSIAPSPDVEVLALFQSQRQTGAKGYEKMMSNIKQTECDGCGLKPNESSQTFSSTEISLQNLTTTPKAKTKPRTENSPSFTDDHMVGEEMATCGEKKCGPIHGESSFSSDKILSQLEKEVVVGDPNRAVDAGSEALQPLLASGAGPSISASSGLDMVTQTCFLGKNHLDLEFLPDSQLQGVLESNRFEFLPHKPFSLDNQHFKGRSDQSAAEEQSGTETSAPVVLIGPGHPNNAKVEMMERICDSFKQEDATDVVCGLIKELSNLNRLIMSKHRDLDSYKRLKFRRNRQSGKILLHNMNNMTSAVKKRKEM